jgi:hypothetical protein
MTTEAMGICVKMNGAVCAGKYCDYWDDEEQICSEARECKLRVEILSDTLEQKKEEDFQKTESKAFKDVAVRLILANPTMTKH